MNINFTILLLLVAFICGCESTGGNNPPQKAPTANMDLKDAIYIAGMLQQSDPSLMPTLGGGSSMEPIYTENTVIIISPIEYDKLESEMIIAYRTKDGRTVVHQLLRRERDGWLAMGLNNNFVDPEKVTEENLKGVVYGVIYTGDSQ